MFTYLLCIAVLLIYEVIINTCATVKAIKKRSDLGGDSRSRVFMIYANNILTGTLMYFGINYIFDACL